MIKQLEIEGGAYCLRIPTSYFIKGYNDLQLVKDYTRNRDKFSTKYSFKINIETSDPITYLSVPNHSEVVKKDQSSLTSVCIS